MKLLYLATLLGAVSPAHAAPNVLLSCFLPEYVPPTQDKIMHGIFYLNGVKGKGDPTPPKTIWGEPGKTRMISCSGKTGFYLIVDAGATSKSARYVPKDLGHGLDDAYHYCYGGPPKDKEVPIPPFQIYGHNYVLLVAGQANCDYRGQVKDSERDFRF